MKSIESIDKTAKSIGASDSINYGVYQAVKVDFATDLTGTGNRSEEVIK